MGRRREFRELEEIEGWKRWVGFVLLNFATPIAFFITFQRVGAKPAIALALGVTVLQAVVHLIYRIRFSPFFIVASSFTVLFGATDLAIDRPQFFRFAPAAQNFVIATGFLGTVLGRIPLVAWFARALPAAVRPELASEEGKAYLRKLSWIWVAYLYGKAALYLWLA